MALSSRCRECKKFDEENKMVSPCSCKNDNLLVHLECLFKSMKINGFNKCKNCEQPFEGIEINKRQVTFVDYISDKKRVQNCPLGLIVTSFAFYTIYLGFFQYLQSHQILKSIWSFFLFSLIVFFSVIFTFIDIYYLFLIHRDYRKWKRSSQMITLKSKQDSSIKLVYSAILSQS